MRASITARAGDFCVTAALHVAPGEVVALVGPNGAGKTTLLRGLAGLAPATGSLLLGDRELLTLPPEQRGIGWVPQAGTLFPHLRAVDNVAYGLRGKLSRRAARVAAMAWLDRLGIVELADRRPGQLSGGQAARVALARALAPDPALLLLDEPLAALDATTRDDVRRMLRATLAGGPVRVLMVTHDPVDALSVADRVVVLEGGAVVQDAAVADLARAPQTPWVAALLGLNAWPGTATVDGVAITGGGQLVVGTPLPVGSQALALVAPSAVALHRQRPEGSPRNTLVGDVTEVTALGGRVRVRVDSVPPVIAEVTVAAAAELALATAGPVWASVKAVEVQLVARV